MFEIDRHLAAAAAESSEEQKFRARNRFCSKCFLLHLEPPTLDRAAFVALEGTLAAFLAAYERPFDV
jgi:hypothetical protein